MQAMNQPLEVNNFRSRHSSWRDYWTPSFAMSTASNLCSKHHNLVDSTLSSYKTPILRLDSQGDSSNDEFEYSSKQKVCNGTSRESDLYKCQTVDNTLRTPYRFGSLDSFCMFTSSLIPSNNVGALGPSPYGSITIARSRNYCQLDAPYQETHSVQQSSKLLDTFESDSSSDVSNDGIFKQCQSFLSYGRASMDKQCQLLPTITRPLTIPSNSSHSGVSNCSEMTASYTPVTEDIQCKFFMNLESRDDLKKDTASVMAVEEVSQHANSSSCYQKNHLHHQRIRFLCRRKNSLNIRPPNVKNRATNRLNSENKCDSQTNNSCKQKDASAWNSSSLFFQPSEFSASDDSDFDAKIEDDGCCFIFSCETSTEINLSSVEDSQLLAVTDEHSTAHFPTKPVFTGMKMVHFSNEISDIKVLYAVEWAEDYALARRGTWVQDRLHFEHRIREVEKKISWVLSAEHRAKFMAAIETV